MSVEKLSPAQLEAVSNRGGALLVSAAAGSGKTRVLVERLFHYITKEHADVDDFLIITFTRAAASELRGRIVEELNSRLSDTPGDSHLRRQLMRVYRADIKTIDSFCGNIVRENVHLLEEDRRGGRLSADFRTLDEKEAALLQERTLSRVLEQYYEENDGKNLLLADAFGYGRDDTALEELILKLYQKIQSHAYPEVWLQRSGELWKHLPDSPGELPYGRELLKRFGRRAEFWAQRLEKAIEDFSAIESINKYYYDGFSAAVSRLRELASLALGGDWERVSAYGAIFEKLGAVRDKSVETEKKAAQAVWNRCKDEIKKGMELFSVSEEEYLSDLRAIAPAMIDLLRLTEEFSLCFREAKNKRNAADFSDQEHDALHLLIDENGDPTELGEAVASRYREIMVDEFQDTNEVQNRIFAAVSKEGKNLFVVGDVKQSIYRFRLADPGIFLEKYSDFAPYTEAEDGEPRKILLSRNYRSRAEVLDAVNFIFENILSEESGEMDYGRDERLYAGNESFVPHEETMPEFHLIGLPRNQSEEQTVKRIDAEARFVAERVSELLHGSYPVQSEDGTLRPVREEDIVILMRSPGNRMKAFYRALEDRGISYSTEASDAFFETVEIAVTFQLLQIIDNPRQDVPLISVLSSPLVGLTPDQLARIRALSPAGDFYTALLASEDAEVKSFLAHLKALRTAAKDLSVTALLARIFDDWNLMGIFGAMEGGIQRRQNLMSLLELARQFEAAGYRGLFAFILQLRELLERGNAPATAAVSSGGGVRIMSIHRSKGLEFPVVILADLSHEFNRKDLNAPVLVHPELGLGPMYIDFQRHIRYPTLARYALEERLEREMRAEEMRILYVAMTRAKEKLIMVMSCTGVDKRLESLSAMAGLPAASEALAGCKCMGEWILLPLLMRAEAGPLRELCGMEMPAAMADDERTWRVNYHNGLDYRDRACVSAVEEGEPTACEPEFSREQLDFVYPYAGDTVLPTVVSATQLKHRDEGTGEEKTAPHIRGIRRPAFLDGVCPLTGSEAGTAAHRLMQFIDYQTDASEESVSREIAKVVSAGHLSTVEADAVRISEIVSFLHSPLAVEMKKAAVLNREYRLSLLVDAREIGAEASPGEKIMLHGVVDCWFENAEGGITVVDFKTDRVFGEALYLRAEEYRPQVEAYSSALERILEKKVTEKILFFFSEGRTVSL